MKSNRELFVKFIESISEPYVEVDRFRYIDMGCGEDTRVFFELIKTCKKFSSAVELKSLFSNKPRNGAGTMFMRMFVAYARQFNVRVFVQAAPADFKDIFGIYLPNEDIRCDFSIGEEELYRFYEKFGFKCVTPKLWKNVMVVREGTDFVLFRDGESRESAISRTKYRREYGTGFRR